MEDNRIDIQKLKNGILGEYNINYIDDDNNDVSDNNSRNKEIYQFTWSGKTKAKKEAQIPVITKLNQIKKKVKTLIQQKVIYRR